MPLTLSITIWKECVAGECITEPRFNETLGGGVSNDVVIGDVCVSNEIIDVLHNNKISENDGSAEISFSPNFYTIDAELIVSFAFLMNHPDHVSSYNQWKELTSAEAQTKYAGEYPEYSPKIEIGPIACGPVSASSAFNEKLKKLHRKLIAIETESGGVFQKIQQAKIPAIAIRGVSDMADNDKSSLEKRTKGNARRLAMLNASWLLKAQLFMMHRLL